MLLELSPLDRDRRLLAVVELCEESEALIAEAIQARDKSRELCAEAMELRERDRHTSGYVETELQVHRLGEGSSLVRIPERRR